MLAMPVSVKTATVLVFTLLTRIGKAGPSIPLITIRWLAAFGCCAPAIAAAATSEKRVFDCIRSLLEDRVLAGDARQVPVADRLGMNRDPEQVVRIVVGVPVERVLRNVPEPLVERHVHRAEDGERR